MKRLSTGLLSLMALILAVTSAFTVKLDGVTTYQWYRNTCPILRPTPAQIVSCGSFLVNATSAGVPLSNFSDGSSTFTPSEFWEYVELVCPQVDPLPICLMLVKRVDGTVQSTPQIVIDGDYTPLP